ncbi:MAG: type I-U CRISPR-associated protein Csb2 [Pseudomonadota bacterium]
MLAIEVEYLAGVAFATTVEDRRRAEWPPHPDRLFSALVDAWGLAGEDQAEAAALRWLETQPAPLVQAAAAHRRAVVDVFVPPNDAATTGKPGTIPKDLGAAVRVLPQLRKNRQPRHFPAVLPDEPRVRFVWPDSAPGTHAPGLARMVDRLVALGHSASLIRATLVDGEAADLPTWRPTDEPAGTTLRWVAEGRLERLRRAFTHGLRANTADHEVSYLGPDDAPPAILPASLMGEQWQLFADDGGTAPALTAFPIVAQRFRDALLSVTKGDIPAELSGHNPDGGPTSAPHLAFVPLADVGFTYSEGRLFGLACVLPRTLETDRRHPARRAILEAVATLARGADGGAVLKLGRLGCWRLRREPVPSRASLNPNRYVAVATRWSTVTPVVLDRFPKPQNGESAEDVVAQACRNAGLPAPVDVVVHKHAAIKGAPSAKPAGRAPAWADWAFPQGSALATRPRTHATLTFADPVRGPVVLGAGRFRGLGLCLPLREGER